MNPSVKNKVLDVLPEVYNSSGKFSDSIKENEKALTNLFIWFVCLPVYHC